jgi:hypothetical protein
MEHEAAQIHSQKKVGRSSSIDNRPRTPLTLQNRASVDEAFHLVDLIYNPLQMDVVVKVGDLLDKSALIAI